MDSMAEDDDWWQIQHGSGAGSPPLMVLLMTADRMKDFRSGLAGADINTQEFMYTNHQLLFYVKFARSAFRPPCDLAGDLADLAGDLAGDLPGDLGYSLPPTTLSSSLHCSSLSSWFNASSV